MKRTRGAGAAAISAAGLLAAQAAFAAGGHHAVDDATILAGGKCEQESWYSRENQGDRTLRVGLNCGVGPVELGVAGTHTHADAGSETAWNLEVKWAHELAGGFSVGLDLQPFWMAQQNPHFALTTLTALATWSPNPELALHLNLGRAFQRAERDQARYGVGADWTPIPSWTFTAERYLQQDTHFLRGGVRWAPGHPWTVDVSYAQRLSGPLPSLWTIGLTFAFDRH